MRAARSTAGRRRRISASSACCATRASLPASDGDETRTLPVLIYAPRGETSGHLSFPIRPLGTVAGRPMLGGLKLLLDRSSLFTDADSHRLPALLKKSRDAQALVSTALAEQVLGALHELLRGLDSAEPALIRELATSTSGPSL